MSTLAVVIPAYNAASHLSVALEGAMAQTRRPDEIIVVDDGSTDRTGEVAERYPVTLIRHDRNRGPAAARNTAIANSACDYVAFLDADDYWTPDHCGPLARLLDQDERIVLACARCAHVGDDTAVPPLGLPAGQAIEPLWTLLRANPVVQSAAVVRRSALIAAGAYDEEMRYSEDYDLWLRLASQGRFIGHDRATCLRRIHPHQLSRNSTVHLIQGAWRARAAVATRLREGGAGEARARLDATLLAAWLAEVKEATRSQSLEALRTLGTVRDLVPGAERYATRWFLWRHLLWSLRRLAIRGVDRFPVVGTPLRVAYRRLRAP